MVAAQGESSPIQSCMTMTITDRQALILKAVVELHHATGRPVGSKLLVEGGFVDASASTVRYELGRLEQLALLEHPHTSAGRVPTDLGWRTYVDHLMELPPSVLVNEEQSTAAQSADDPSVRIDEALRMVSGQLAEATGLLAVITAPRASGTIIRHIEVLKLDARRVVIVVITASGDVARHVAITQNPVDSGLVDWAGEYLSERITGLGVGDHRISLRMQHRELATSELVMLALLKPVFDQLNDTRQELVVGGLTVEEIAQHDDDVQRVLQLVAMLDQRRRLLEALRPAIERGRPVTGVETGRRVTISIGGENDLPELQRLSVVGAQYGVGMTALGMVGLIGPRSMDYPLASRAVHTAAEGLSLLADDLYDGGMHQ